MLLSSVFRTLLSRRELKLFIAFAFFPLVVPLFAMSMEGLGADYSKDFLSFLQVTLETQQRIVLPTLIFSLLISSVFRDEIDSKILFLFKDINRRKVFHAKLLALMFSYGLYVLLTLVMALLSYYLVMVPMFGVNIVLAPQETLVALQSSLSILVIVGMNLTTIALVSVLSIKTKTITAALSGIFFTLFMLIAPLWVGLRYLAPLYYAGQFQENPLASLLGVVVCFMIYFGFNYLKGLKAFKRIEF